MIKKDQTTPKQKEILAQFYSNLALAILTLGIIAPLFTNIGNIILFVVRFILSLIFTVGFLKVALNFLK